MKHFFILYYKSLSNAGNKGRVIIIATGDGVSNISSLIADRGKKKKKRNSDILYNTIHLLINIYFYIYIYIYIYILYY